MNCVLFAKMDQVFSLKKQNIKKYTGKMGKDTGKVREKSVRKNGNHDNSTNGKNIVESLRNYAPEIKNVMI